MWGPEGQPIEHLGVTPTPTRTFYSHDHNGNTRALLSATGTVTASYTYTPYGALTTKTGTATTPLQYGTGYTDTETGLIYLIHRYYHPQTGQFTTTDPLTALTRDPYGYVNGEPIHGADPVGLFEGPGSHPDTLLRQCNAMNRNSCNWDSGLHPKLPGSCESWNYGSGDVIDVDMELLRHQTLHRASLILTGASLALDGAAAACTMLSIGVCAAGPAEVMVGAATVMSMGGRPWT